MIMFVTVGVFVVGFNVLMFAGSESPASLSDTSREATSLEPW